MYVLCVECRSTACRVDPTQTAECYHQSLLSYLFNLKAYYIHNNHRKRLIMNRPCHGGEKLPIIVLRGARGEKPATNEEKELTK